jgi:type IV secretory pathway VirB2 component (pilin)
MKEMVAALLGWLVRTATKEWALRHGFEQWIASLLSWAAGAIASTALLRA